MKKINTAVLFVLLPFLLHTNDVLLASGTIGTAVQDSTAYQSFHGKVVDSETNNPVIFANVFLAGTNIGTVSNSEGEFLIKVPMYIENKAIVFSSIGYKNLEISVEQLDPENNNIVLEPNPIPIEQVTIVNQEARDLLAAALRMIPRNYSEEPVMTTSFYRETIKQNRNYVSVSEAVLDGYKASYTNLMDRERIKIFKGRKSQDVKKMDTILFKLQGGPITMFMLDFVKSPGELLQKESMDNFIYQMGGIVNIDDMQAYVIKFDQKEDVDFPFYSGEYYVGVEGLAFMGADFHISEKKLEKASQYLVLKKPFGMRIEVQGANYLIKYRYSGNKWHLNYVRTELRMAVRWNKKLFRSVYSTMSELALTDIDTENITKYKFRETTRRTDVFAEQVSDFEDPDFWGEYNIIQPEENIQTAIQRIERKLKRRNN